MRANEIMTDDVVTIRATQSVADALEVLAERGIRHLPVIGDGGRLVGMLSDRDIRSLGVTRVLSADQLAQLQGRLSATVASAMSSNVATVAPETELTELIDTMLEEGVGAIPVVDEESDTLVGIVSYVDVLRAVRSVAADI